MARQVTRLSDFHIPRAEGIVSESNVSKSEPEAPAIIVPVEPPPPPQELAEALVREQAPEHAILPVRIAPRPVAEPRQALTVRLPVSMHERVRMLMFTSRRSQQDIVEEALHVFLKANDT